MAHLWTGGGQPPPEYADLVLCRDVYHCLPSQLDEEDAETISLHLAMMDAEAYVRDARSGKHRVRGRGRKATPVKEGA